MEGGGTVRKKAHSGINETISQRCAQQPLPEGQMRKETKAARERLGAVPTALCLVPGLGFLICEADLDLLLSATPGLVVNQMHTCVCDCEARCQERATFL